MLVAFLFFFLSLFLFPPSSLLLFPVRGLPWELPGAHKRLQVEVEVSKYLWNVPGCKIQPTYTHATGVPAMAAIDLAKLLGYSATSAANYKLLTARSEVKQ